jgi:DNA-binding MarR family transcriptional regulator
MNAHVVNEIRDVHDTIKNMERQLVSIAAPTHIDLWEMAQDMRRTRDSLFPTGYFADAAWEILLDLARAERDNRRLAISDVGLGARLPPTTCLRYLNLLESDGFIRREPDAVDRRRVYVVLTEDGAAKMITIFSKINAKFRPVRFDGMPANDG